MSSASDLNAFEHSVEPATGEVLFSGKKWTYIQDSSSNSGQYSGQIQFNLSSISSQAAFVNWSEAVIQLPVKLQILNGGGSSITSTASATIDQRVPKAGAWQFIDSVSVVIDGVTVQTNQIHENVNSTFKTPTEWSLQDAQKGGTIGEHGLANTYSNSGARERSLFTSVNTAVGTLAYDVAGSAANAQNAAKPLVWVAPAGTVASGASFYVTHYIATIHLADICDFFKEAPMSKNAKGLIYLNYNSSLYLSRLVQPPALFWRHLDLLCTDLRIGLTTSWKREASDGVGTTVDAICAACVAGCAVVCVGSGGPAWSSCAARFGVECCGVFLWWWGGGSLLEIVPDDSV
ncbi:unnamed protein product [Phytophthora fragariaefolia]|uniref:Unnamed protein product n=1 Tax=Phytophthora fragariaefolia TaxID=1490495 RepID=A0A9W7DAV3_9STRA|nr:unnamed protein product [Phytophthora fragariaefolia]